jgi:hypothetical protein
VQPVLGSRPSKAGGALDRRIMSDLTNPIAAPCLNIYDNTAFWTL